MSDYPLGRRVRITCDLEVFGVTFTSIGATGTVTDKFPPTDNYPFVVAIDHGSDPFGVVRLTADEFEFIDG